MSWNIGDLVQATAPNTGQTQNAAQVAVWLGLGPLATALTPLALSLGGTGLTTWAAITNALIVATATAQGVVSPPNDTTKYLRGDATWATLSAVAVPTTRLINTTAPITGGGDLSADRTIAISNFTGDSGAGGVKGAVLAPAAGDAAAKKYLFSDGTWRIILTSDLSGPVTVPQGGTGAVSFTAYGVMCGGVSSTAVLQNIAVGLAGNVLISNGAGALPGFGAIQLDGGANWVINRLPLANINTPSDSTKFFRGDSSWAVPPSATATVAGYVPTPPNDTTKYLRGDATWVAPPLLPFGYAKKASPGDYTVAAADNGLVIDIQDDGVDSALVVLPATNGAGIGAGFTVTIRNVTTAGLGVQINTDGTDGIDERGATIFDLLMAQYSYITYVSTGNHGTGVGNGWIVTGCRDFISKYTAKTGQSINAGVTVSSFALPPGEWDCNANGCYLSGSVAVTAIVVGISTTNNTIVGNEGDDYAEEVGSYAANNTTSVPQVKKIVTDNSTTLYLVMQINASSGGCSIQGRLSARRFR